MVRRRARTFFLPNRGASARAMQVMVSRGDGSNVANVDPVHVGGIGGPAAGRRRAVPLFPVGLPVPLDVRRRRRPRRAVLLHRRLHRPGHRVGLAVGQVVVLGGAQVGPDPVPGAAERASHRGPERAERLLLEGGEQDASKLEVLQRAIVRLFNMQVLNGMNLNGNVYFESLNV